jgi:hypothetical protein
MSRKKIFYNWMVRDNSTVVEHSTGDHEIKGSIPANHHSTPGENVKKNIFLELDGQGQ